MGLVQKTALIVDDDRSVSRYAQHILERQGMRTILAGSVEEALGRLDGVDVVLLDLELPGVSGHALLKALRTSGRKALPVIIVSGTGTIEDVIEALRNRASDYVRKPFFPEQLTAAVDRALFAPSVQGEAKEEVSVDTLLTDVERGLVTEREKDIIGLLVQGRRAPEMATVLGISSHTIRNHLKAIYRKLGVHSQGALAELMFERRQRGP
jgi:two-component system nitrate/nitrite response regulator NarL